MWKRLLWTEESVSQVFRSSRRVFVRKEARERLIQGYVMPTVKHDGDSVFVWGCFSFAGIGFIYKIEGILRKENYKDILENNAIPSRLRIVGNQFYLQQNNNPKHISKYTGLPSTKRLRKKPYKYDFILIEILWNLSV